MSKSKSSNSRAPDPATETKNESEPSLKDKLKLESGSITWSELARHFARGVVIRVEPSVELVEAAMCFATDDTATLQCWLDTGEVLRASDDDARDWHARNSTFTCVVAAPWVLVQEINDNKVYH